MSDAKFLKVRAQVSFELTFFSSLPLTTTTMSGAPFEGPEKLLEIWFAPSPDAVPDASNPVEGRTGLRKIPSSIWDEMLNIVRCQVLSSVTGDEIDAYLLRSALYTLVSARR